jgi:hypothetical protein
MLQRKIASSFKDQSLFQVFQISLTSLRQLKNDGIILTFIFEWNLCIFFSFKFLVDHTVNYFFLVQTLFQFVITFFFFTFTKKKKQLEASCRNWLFHYP